MEFPAAMEVVEPNAFAPSSSSSSSSSSCNKLPSISDGVVSHKLDLKSYVDRYSGYTKLSRLQFIAERCPNLQEEAYRMLLAELKRGSNTGWYTKTHGMVGAALGVEFDKAWVDATEKKEATKLERLEADLMAAKTTMVKESIRLSYNDIGDFHYDRGNLNEALKSYLRARDYCTLPKHTFDMCVRVASVSFDLTQYRNVVNYVGKADDADGDVLTRAKLNAAAGLVLLVEGQYKAAARKFVEVDCELGGNYATIVAAEDIALYGTLCALASLDRAELRRSLHENPNFKAFLELTPDVRALAQNFVAGRYGDCLAYLEAAKSELLLDMHLSKHAAALVTAITERLVVQYFSPYSTVDMRRMAQDLQMTVEKLERDVAALITRGQLPGRIDSHSKTLHRTQQEVRAATVGRVLKVSQRHLGEIKRGILRLSVMQHNLHVASREYQGGGAHGKKGMHGGARGNIAAAASSSSSGGDAYMDVDSPPAMMYDGMDEDRL